MNKRRYPCSSFTRRLEAVVFAILVVIATSTAPAAETEDILIGYFGPASATHPDGGDLWCAASLAIEEANADGGYEGRPFRLVPSWSDNPWGTGVADVARLVYKHRVWGIIGGIDGATTHLAEQVVAKARLVLINPVATDKSINMASVPWMFSCVPLDDTLARVVAQAIAADVGHRPFVIISANDHDAHLFTVELLKALKEHEVAPAFHFDCDPSKPEHSQALNRARRAAPEAIVLAADAVGSARLLAELRKQGYDGAVFGGPWMGRRTFFKRAGPAAKGVQFPCALTPSKRLNEFQRRFIRRFGHPPDYAAAHTYDAVCLLVAAIRQAGLDRAAIGEAVRRIAPWSGVTGKITWNAVGANTRPARLVTADAEDR